MSIKGILKRVLSDNQLEKIRLFIEKLLILSINKALKEQQLFELKNKLSSIVPDIRHQYSCFEIDTKYLELKVRAEHAFQFSLIQKAIDILDITEDSSIVDIGDSSGTHIQYIISLLGNFHALSVDLNPKAVEKVKNKGLVAVCARAEELDKFGITADLFLSFEMLEHLHNPIDFLRNLSTTNCKGFVLTVPYRAQSRVSLNHIRHNNKMKVSAENTHVFELSRQDWKLLLRHSG